ncbi:DinF_protein [Hexamita inflata]|uniref:DinF protein n=2 Tax=Hexamita inflata TaxID=28002 RepID=A0AA86U041_9EUKA|nr:DinF protein [Hexamita inflata]
MSTNELNKNLLESASTINTESFINSELYRNSNSMNDKIVNRLQDMSINKLLWQFALPAILANTVSAVTNGLQTTVQKNIMGNDGISAQSIVQPLELMLTMYIAVGLSGGVVSFISPAFGSKDMKTAQKYLMHFMVLYFFVIVLVPLCTLPWLRQIVVLLGAPAGSEMAEYAYQYGLVIFSCGTVFYFINYGFGNILRATSRSVFNAVKQIITATLQLCFIYIFYYTIVKQHPSLYYSALSPVLANALCAVPVILLFIPFKKHFTNFKLKFAKTQIQFKFLAQIIYYSIPDMLTQFQTPLIVTVANILLSKVSISDAETTQWISNLGIVYQLSALIQVTNQSFSYAFGPIFGYALGAKNWKRIREIMLKTLLWQTGTGLACWILLNIFVDKFCLNLMQGYIPQADDVSFGFRCFNACMPVMSCFLCVNDINQMEQKPMKAFLVQISRLVFIVVFEAILCLTLQDQKGIYYAFIIGDVLSAIIGAVNFTERYLIYGKLEKGEITAEQAGLGDKSGNKKKMKDKLYEQVDAMCEDDKSDEIK